MYIWMWFFFLLIPVAIFSATPSAPPYRHILRLFVAFVIGYSCLNITLYVDIDRQWRAYNECCKEKGLEDRCELEEYVKPVRVCPPAPNSGGPEVTMLFVYGWVSTLGYMGLWELVWRVVHHSRIKRVEEALEAKLLSAIVVILLIPTARTAFSIITLMASK